MMVASCIRPLAASATTSWYRYQSFSVRFQHSEMKPPTTRPSMPISMNFSMFSRRPASSILPSAVTGLIGHW